MNDELYREFERVCMAFYRDLDWFLSESQAEVKPMLYDDLERLTPLALDAHGNRNPVFVRQIRNRLPSYDVSHALWDRLIWDGQWAERLVDQLENHPVAKRVVEDLWKKARIVVNAIDAANYGAWDERSDPLFRVP